MPKKILFCGHRCFAAQGLKAKLDECGNNVTTFSRGPIAREGNHVTGPVMDLAENPHLEDPFDVAINYIYLKSEPLDDNRRFIEALLHFCETRSVKHLIHISSCSVYKNNAKYVDEDAPAETKPSRKGVYAAIKVVQEEAVRANRPPGLRVSLVRPGLILANGMGGFLGGIALRLPWNSVVGLGSAGSQLPLVTRDATNACVVALVNSPPEEDVEALLLADSKSPTRRQYVENCRDVMGAGAKVRFFPVFLWKTAAFCGEILSRLIGKGHFGIYGKISSVCRFQRFNAERTEKRVGVRFSADWKEELYDAFDCQKPNFVVPPISELERAISAQKINYVGFGRIVKQRHLPALKRLGLHKEIEAYDLTPGKDATGIDVRSIRDAKPTSADLTVVCTPGPIHTEALDILKDLEGPILVEKPLCYSNEELEQWLRLARGRKDPVTCCHNTRYKSNVLKMLTHLTRYNPGKLHHVSVVFQSGSVRQESVPWLRDERNSRTLLMDYGIHLIDLACIFAQGSPCLERCRHELDRQGETSLIEGSARFDNHTISFLLRQGLHQRKGRVVFTFENYSVSLGLAPDIFVPHMADDNFGLSWLETRAALRATFVKATDRLFGRNSELSHVHVLEAALARDSQHPPQIERLASIYELLFEISESVYGD